MGRISSAASHRAARPGTPLPLRTPSFAVADYQRQRSRLTAAGSSGNHVPERGGDALSRSGHSGEIE